MPFTPPTPSPASLSRSGSPTPLFPPPPAHSHNYYNHPPPPTPAQPPLSSSVAMTLSEDEEDEFFSGAAVALPPMSRHSSSDSISALSAFDHSLHPSPVPSRAGMHHHLPPLRGGGGGSRTPSRPPSGETSRSGSRPPSRSGSRLGSRNTSASSLMTALGALPPASRSRGVRRASMVALANVGNVLGGQLGGFISRIGEGVGGSTVMPAGIEEEEDDECCDDDHSSSSSTSFTSGGGTEIEKIKAQAQMRAREQQAAAAARRKRKAAAPQALFGNGTAGDAEKSAFTLIMLVTTFFALWGTDLYELCDPALANDRALYTLVNVVFGMFVVEFLFYSLFKPGYVGSFFFYLDFLSAISLLPDALLMWNIQVFSSGGSGLAVARAGRAARAGTRAARIVRIFKLFSLIRRRKSSTENSKEYQKKKAGLQQEEPASKVGTALTSGITQKVIIIIAIMLIVSQLLDLISSANAFSNIQPSVITDLESLAVIFDAVNGNISAEPFYSTMVSVIAAVNGPSALNSTCPPAALFPVLDRNNTDLTGCALRHLRINGVDIWGNGPPSYADLRVTPQERSVNVAERSDFVLATDTDARTAALTNILTVLFVALLLAVSSALFQRDADKLVIAPLELMARMVKQLAHDPLNVLEFDLGDDHSLDSETRLVALAIIKLSQMLQVGFGEAGASIIQANMASDSDRINPVLPGRRIQGIYGFCDIRNFTDCTECLQTDVMVFVNRISDFVHRAVKDNRGAPNKNIGDAFLLVWRLPERNYSHHHHGHHVGPGGSHSRSHHDFHHSLYDQKSMADSALESFCRIIVETAVDRQLLELTSRQAVQDRIPGYAVRMGFGLHAGWGIEGAIGSVMKIDATYLSPNVNMCARLEGATKTYGCVMLLTDAFYDLLSPPVQKLCRRVDRVTARGASAPFDLYTFDAVRMPSVELIKSGETFWERFPPTTSESFRATFALGVKAYIAGEWQKAATHLDECLEQVPSDGPSRFLSTLISDNRNVCPANWPGYRLNGVD